MAATATRKRRRTGAKCPCGCGQAPAQTTRLRKAECGSCGYVIRLSREMIERGLPECPCGYGTMECPCTWDRSLYDADALGEAMAAATPERFRARKSGWKHAPQCKSCRRILANPGRECPGCGYLDGAGFIGGGRDLPF